MTELGELEDDRQVERDGADVAAPDRDGLPSSLHQSERKARQPMGDVMAPYCWKISETLPFSDERLR